MISSKKRRIPIIQNNMHCFLNLNWLLAIINRVKNWKKCIKCLIFGLYIKLNIHFKNKVNFYIYIIKWLFCFITFIIPITYLHIPINMSYSFQLLNLKFYWNSNLLLFHLIKNYRSRKWEKNVFYETAKHILNSCIFFIPYIIKNKSHWISNKVILNSMLLFNTLFNTPNNIRTYFYKKLPNLLGKSKVTWQ